MIRFQHITINVAIMCFLQPAGSLCWRMLRGG